MFIGHFGAGFGAKSIAPQISLGWLFAAAQFIDLLWPTLLLAGVETVRIAPGATAVTPLVFDHYPVSHSLLAVAGWAVLVGGIYLVLRKDRRGALVLAALVVSHWLLDAIVHQPDLPLYPGSATLVGMNAWSSIPLSLAIEVPLFLAGAWLYARRTAAVDAVGRWAFMGLVVFLLGIQAGNVVGPPPPSVQAIAWVGQAQWLLVLWGYWVDNHRRPESRP
ncbi:MAG: metal-dependent hydrolase [Betaproteobacteria bacterium]|nr:metal-dependent hydrolase [Betaproteobacteria bacterium]